MTEGSRTVLDYLKKHFGKEFTKHELVETLDVSMSVVTGSVNSLITKGYVSERIEIIPPKYKGHKEVVIKFVTLTEAGLAFDPDEEERRKAQARLELTAARKKARAEEKRERARLNSVL